MLLDFLRSTCIVDLKLKSNEVLTLGLEASRDDIKYHIWLQFRKNVGPIAVELNQNTKEIKLI